MTRVIDIESMTLYFQIMKRSPEKRDSQSDVRRGRAELWDWLPVAATLLPVSVIFELRAFGSDDSLKLFWSLLNVVPGLLIVRVVVRNLRRADEYQKVAQLEALAIGFGVMMLATFTIGLLQAGEVGDLRQLVQISFVASMLIWIAALMYKRGR
jgi:hypothetical protein